MTDTTNTDETEEEVVESLDETETVKETSEDNDEVPSRDNASQIIARQKRTIEKLRSKEEQESESPALNDRLSALEEANKTYADERDLQTLFAANPEAKEYDKDIRRYMKHDSYRGVAPEVIYHHLAYSKAAKSGAQQKAVADLEAEQMGGAGSSSRPTETTSNFPSAEELDKMSDEEFEKLEFKVRRGDFLPDDDPRK